MIVATVAEQIDRMVRERRTGRESHQQAAENIAAEILARHALATAGGLTDPTGSSDDVGGGSDGHTA